MKKLETDERELKFNALLRMDWMLSATAILAVRFFRNFVFGERLSLKSVEETTVAEYRVLSSDILQRFIGLQGLVRGLVRSRNIMSTEKVVLGRQALIPNAWDAMTGLQWQPVQGARYRSVLV